MSLEEPDDEPLEQFHSSEIPTLQDVEHGNEGPSVEFVDAGTASREAEEARGERINAKPPSLPIALDRVLVHRHEQLALQLLMQQNKFIQSLQKMLRGNLSQQLASPELTVAIPKTEAVSVLSEQDTSPEIGTSKVEALLEEDASTASTRAFRPSLMSLSEDAPTASTHDFRPSVMSTGDAFAAPSRLRASVGSSSEDAPEATDNTGRRVAQTQGSPNNTRKSVFEYHQAVAIGIAKKESQRATTMSHQGDIPARKDMRGIIIALEPYLTKFFAVALMANCLYLGIEVEYDALTADDAMPDAFLIISAMFLLVFLIELVFSMAVQGMKKFWVGPERGWNLFDFVINLCCLAGFVGEVISSGSTASLGMLRTLRLIRAVRAIRAVKLVKSLRALRQLIESIVASLRALLWSTVLVSLIIYCCAIVFTSVTIHSEDATSNDHLQEYFGTLHKAVHTLFRSISGGLSWTLAADALEEISWVWMYLFTVYVAFVYFAVLNVMTATFCQSAIEAAQRNKDAAIQSVLSNRQRFESMLLDLFHQIDDDCSGSISFLEFEEHFDDEAVKFLLHGLELEVEDAWTLFQMLDQDGSYDIDEEEFLDGCMHLKGNAKAFHLAKLQRKTEKAFRALDARLATMQEVAEVSKDSLVDSLRAFHLAQLQHNREDSLTI